jgi:TRAP-type C4-dicarboxylate transport system permease small subunit
MNSPTGRVADGTHPVVQLLLAGRKVLITGLEWVLIIAVALLTLDVLWGVFSRRILGGQSRWTEELARVLLIWVALLGTSVAFAKKGHLGVDFFVRPMDRGAQRLVRALVHLIVFYFAASVMVWGGLRLVWETLRLEQMMMALNVPKGYVYMAVPISGVFVVLFSLESLVQSLVQTPQTTDVDEEANQSSGGEA